MSFTDFTPFGFGHRPSCPLFSGFADDPAFSDYPAFAAVDDARVDWREETCEARVFKADLPGRHKRGVKVEVGGSSVQIRDERTCKREKKTNIRPRVDRQKKTEIRHRVEREKTTETWHRVDRQKKGETWHRVEREKTTDTWHCVEREKKPDTKQRGARKKKTDSGEVLRRFRLPANVKVNQVKVSMENRMLTITVPDEGVKKPVKKPRGKSIKIYG